MKTFKSTQDLQKLSPDDPAHPVIKKLIEDLIGAYSDYDTSYRPEDDGYLVLLESDDVGRVLDDLDMPWRLSEVPFEAVELIDGCFHAVYIPNNQFALSILVPDAEWLPDEVRRHLEDHLDP